MLKLVMKTKLKFALFFFFISLFSVFLLNKFAYKIPVSLNKPATTNNKYSSLNLSGRIIYQKGSSLVSHNLATKEDTTLLKDLITDNSFPEWTYSNGYLFAINSLHQIIRVNLTTFQQDIINIDLSFCSIKSTSTSFCDVSYLFPSPDGTRLVFAVSGDTDEKFGMDVSPNFISILAYQNFDSPQLKIISKFKNSTSLEDSTWFPDNKYFYLGQKKILDTDNFKQSSISGLNSNTLYPSFTGHSYLWLNNQKYPVTNGAFEGTIDRPDLMYGSLGTFYKSFIPFVNFPLIARDFKSITRVLPIHNQYEFLIESDSKGKSDIFLTDVASTFKKLNPNNSDSYALISYLPKLQKILALRIKENRALGYKALSTQLVTLDESNYSENIADIDTAGITYHEKNIYTFTDPEYFFGINHWMGYHLKPYAISPDDQFLMLPLKGNDYDHYSNFIVIDLISSNTFNLDLQTDGNFLWLE